jgi:hypothetical protein
MAWTLTLANVTKTLAEWGAQNVFLRRRHLVADVLTFTAPRPNFADAELCAFNAAAVLQFDGAVWFTGTREVVPAEASATSETQTYSFRGPWRWLEDNVYQQSWYGGTIPTSHCLLNGSIGQNIKAVLDYAIANGAQLQYSLADLNAFTIFPPVSEFTEKLCAEAILEQLHFAPDVVAWLDYTTSPPLLRLQNRGSLTAVQLQRAGLTPVQGVPAVEQITLIPRPDLQVPSVKINGETINTINGDQFLIPSVDVFPLTATGREDRAFNAVITLQGITQTNVFAELECATILPNDLEWLKAHHDGLRDPRVNILRLVPGSVLRYDEDGNLLPFVYARELLPGGGQIAEWMEVAPGDPVVWQREIFRFKVDLEFNEIPGDNTPLIGLKDQLFSFELITTNAPDGVSTYSAIAEAQSGDPPIVGLAQFLYNALNPLHYEGSVSLVEQDCTGAIELGRVLNLLESAPGHETMRALVQEVAFDLDNGRTIAFFGPPRHLSVTDILALLQRFRTRRRWTNPAVQDTGEIAGNTSDVNLGRAIANTNTMPGEGVTELKVFKADVTDNQGNVVGPGKVEIDAALARRQQGAVTFPMTLSIREVEVCVNSTTKHMLVIASEPY